MTTGSGRDVALKSELAQVAKLCEQEARGLERIELRQARRNLFDHEGAIKRLRAESDNPEFVDCGGRSSDWGLLAQINRVF